MSKLMVCIAERSSGCSIWAQPVDSVTVSNVIHLRWVLQGELIVILDDQSLVDRNCVRVLSPVVGIGWMEVGSVAAYLRDVK